MCKLYKVSLTIISYLFKWKLCIYFMNVNFIRVVLEINSNDTHENEILFRFPFDLLFALSVQFALFYKAEHHVTLLLYRYVRSVFYSTARWCQEFQHLWESRNKLTHKHSCCTESWWWSFSQSQRSIWGHLDRSESDLHLNNWRGGKTIERGSKGVGKARFALQLHAHGSMSGYHFDNLHISTSKFIKSN